MRKRHALFLLAFIGLGFAGYHSTRRAARPASPAPVVRAQDARAHSDAPRSDSETTDAEPAAAVRVDPATEVHAAPIDRIAAAFDRLAQERRYTFKVGVTVEKDGTALSTVSTDGYFDSESVSLCTLDLRTPEGVQTLQIASLGEDAVVREGGGDWEWTDMAGAPLADSGASPEELQEFIKRLLESAQDVRDLGETFEIALPAADGQVSRALIRVTAGILTQLTNESTRPGGLRTRMDVRFSDFGRDATDRVPFEARRLLGVP